jgi:hypothetical protein
MVLFPPPVGTSAIVRKTVIAVYAPIVNNSMEDLTCQHFVIYVEINGFSIWNIAT